MNNSLEKQLEKRKKNYAKNVYNDVIKAYETIEVPQQALDIDEQLIAKKHELIDLWYAKKANDSKELDGLNNNLYVLKNNLNKLEEKRPVNGATNYMLEQKIKSTKDEICVVEAKIVSINNTINAKYPIGKLDDMIKELSLSAMAKKTEIINGNLKEKFNDIINTTYISVDKDTFDLVKEMIKDNNPELLDLIEYDTKEDVKEQKVEVVEETKEEAEVVEEIKEEAEVVEETKDEVKVEETKDEVKDIDKEELTIATELVEKAEETKESENIDRATEAVKNIKKTSDEKKDLIARLTKLALEIARNKKKENIDVNVEAYTDLESFNGLYNELHEQMINDKDIDSKKLNKLNDMAIGLKKEDLESNLDKINELNRYANAKTELARQNDELSYSEKKVGLINKVSAMLIAFSNRRKLNKQAKYARKLEQARENNDEIKEEKYLNKLVESDEYTDYRVGYLSNKIHNLKAKELSDGLDDDELEELEDSKKEFENVAFDEYADMDMDKKIINEPARLKGLVTSVAEAIAMVPTSKKLNAVKKGLLNTINSNSNISDLEKAAYNYEFDKVSDFYEVNNEEYVEYDPTNFKYFDEDSEYAKHGIYTYNGRNK